MGAGFCVLAQSHQTGSEAMVEAQVLRWQRSNQIVLLLSKGELAALQVQSVAAGEG